MKPDKILSPSQLDANRRNAASSTGPRTPQGCAVSRMNALKHGILSQEVLVRSRNLQESEQELQALHERFWEDLQPVGPVEELLVDQIVTAHWRMRRALTAESGEIALSVDHDRRKRRREPNLALLWTKWTAFGDPVLPMQQSSIGNAILQKMLTEVRQSVQANGALTAEALQQLVAHFGGRPNSLVQELESFCQELAADPDRLPERQTTRTLAFLDRLIDRFQARLESCVDDEECEGEASQAAAVLPSPEKLDKILRYETKLERQMYRAMFQLERVQRMRHGESIPAPLSMDVSGRG